MKQKVITVQNMIPSHIPFKCPVCNGYGTVGKYNEAKECHGCGGLGWVVVEQGYVDATDVI